MALDGKQTRIALDERDTVMPWGNVVEGLPGLSEAPVEPVAGQPIGYAEAAIGS